MNVKNILTNVCIFTAGLVAGSAITQYIMKKAMSEEIEDLLEKKEVVEKSEITVLAKEKSLNDTIDKLNIALRASAKREPINECKDEDLEELPDDFKELYNNLTDEDEDEISDTDIIADYMINKQLEEEEILIKSIERNRDVPPRLVSLEEFDQIRWGHVDGYDDYSLISWQWYRDNVLVNDLYGEAIPQEDLVKYIGDIDLEPIMSDVDRIEDCAYIINDKYKLLIEVDEMPTKWYK